MLDVVAILCLLEHVESGERLDVVEGVSAVQLSVDPDLITGICVLVIGQFDERRRRRVVWMEILQYSILAAVHVVWIIRRHGKNQREFWA